MSKVSHIAVFIIAWLIAVLVMNLSLEWDDKRLTDEEIYDNILNEIEWVQAAIGDKNLSDVHTHMNNNKQWVLSSIRIRREGVCNG